MGLGFAVEDSGFRVQGLGCGVWGSGCGVGQAGVLAEGGGGRGVSCAEAIRRTDELSLPTYSGKLFSRIEHGLVNRVPA